MKPTAVKRRLEPTQWCCRALLAPIAVAALLWLLPGAAGANEPAALVEEIEAASVTDLAYMDYVYEGMVLDLGSSGTITLSYLRSCRVERITGGIVRVGDRRSEVTSPYPLDVEEVDCDGGGIVPTDRQREDAAGVAFRSLKLVETDPAGDAEEDPVVVYSTAPLFRLSVPATELTISRLDPGWEETVTLQVDGKILDLGKQGLRLRPGGRYRATTQANSVLFTIDRRARSAVGTVVERLIGL